MLPAKLQRSSEGCCFALVEQRVISVLEEYVKGFSITERKDKPAENSIIPFKEKALKKKLDEVSQLTTQKNNLHDLLERGAYDIDTFMERQKNIVERIKKFEEEARQLKEEIYKEEMKNKNVNEFVPKLKKVLEGYRQTNDIEKKNRLLKTVLEKATYLRKQEWTKRDHFEIQVYLKI
jgi:site-specific DNA recombinase